MEHWGGKDLPLFNRFKEKFRKSGVLIVGLEFEDFVKFLPVEKLIEVGRCKPKSESNSATSFTCF